MDFLIKFAEGFMGLFQTGAETFISWMTGIVPVVLLLMVAMNTLIAFLGEERVTKVAQASSKNPFTRYLILPFLSAFMLGNPMSFTMARFLPEYYKPSYYASHQSWRTVRMDGNCSRNYSTRLELNGTSDSLYVGRSCYELYRRLGHRLYNSLCL